MISLVYKFLNETLSERIGNSRDLPGRLFVGVRLIEVIKKSINFR